MHCSCLLEVDGKLLLFIETGNALEVDGRLLFIEADGAQLLTRTDSAV